MDKMSILKWHFMLFLAAPGQNKMLKEKWHFTLFWGDLETDIVLAVENGVYLWLSGRLRAWLLPLAAISVPDANC
jgi:hypothetical protein